MSSQTYSGLPHVAGALIGILLPKTAPPFIARRDLANCRSHEEIQTNKKKRKTEGEQNGGGPINYTARFLLSPDNEPAPHPFPIHNLFR